MQNCRACVCFIPIPRYLVEAAGRKRRERRQDMQEVGPTVAAAAHTRPVSIGGPRGSGGGGGGGARAGGMVMGGGPSCCASRALVLGERSDEGHPLLWDSTSPSESPAPPPPPAPANRAGPRTLAHALPSSGAMPPSRRSSWCWGPPWRTSRALWTEWWRASAGTTASSRALLTSGGRWRWRLGRGAGLVLGAGYEPTANDLLCAMAARVLGF